MHFEFTCSTRMLQALGAAALTVALSGEAVLAGVSLHVSSTTVQSSGNVGQICVSLSTGGEQVAGTQNDLVWDGSCATLASPGSCVAVGSHGKQLQGGFPPQFDFTFRALILSLSDVDPMPDGPLYCCSFQSEAPPGDCCSISIVRPGASDPKGTALGVAGAGRGQICTAADSNRGGRSTGGVGADRPGVASNVGDQPVGAPPVAAPAAPAGGAPAGGAPPAAAVLPGGGVRVPDVPAESDTPAQPAIPTAVPPAALAAAGVTPMQLPVAPPTAAATIAPTTAAVADTATAAPEATAPPTAAANPPTAAPKAERKASSESGGGWFGCQIRPASASPLWVIGAPLAAAALVRRRRRGHGARQPNNH